MTKVFQISTILPARAYIHTMAELQRLFGILYQATPCPKHGSNGIKVCGACERTACGVCDPEFCRCQIEKAQEAMKGKS